MNDYIHNEANDVSTVLRDAIERGWYKKIRTVLREFKSEKDTAIDKICHQHYGEFLGSVTELLSIRSLTSDLRDEIVSYNDEFFESARNLTDSLEEIENAAMSRDDAGALYRTASECHSLADLMYQARESISGKNFHSAVRTLKEIQHNKSKESRFLTQNVTSKSWFPEISRQLLELETADVDAFLLEVRLDASVYGATLIRRFVLNFQSKCIPQLKRMQSLKSLDSYTFSTFYFLRFGSAFNLNAWIESRDFDKIASLHFSQGIPSDGLEKLKTFFDKMGPLLHALHTFSLLGQCDTFFEHYREMRKTEIDKAIESAGKAAAKHGLSNTFPSLCSVIIGLFSIETLFVRCISESDVLPPLSPFDSLEIARLWEDVCSRILKICQKNIASLVSPNDFLSLKEDILLLAEVVQDPALNLSPEPLFHIVESLWSTFEFIQQGALTGAVEKYLKENLCRQCKITTQSMLKSTVTCFGLDLVSMHLDNSSNSPYPKLFAFSAALPFIIRELHLFVVRFFMYSYKCPNLSSKGEVVCKSVLSAFESIAQIYYNILKEDGVDTTVSKACQVSIDASCLASGSDALWATIEQLLSHFRWTESMNLHLPRTIVSAKTCISKLATQSQEFMFELLGAKIDELLTSISLMDWKPSRRPVENARSYIDELIDFLRATLGCLSSLPGSAIEAAYFHSCSHVASGVITYITSPQVAAINVNCLLGLEMDVMKLEKFADDSQIPNLRQCFTELNSLITALTSSDLIGISKDDSRGMEKRQQRHPQLNTRHLATVLEKIVPSGGPVVGRVASAGPVTVSTLDASSLKSLAKVFRSLPR